MGMTDWSWGLKDKKDFNRYEKDKNGILSRKQEQLGKQMFHTKIVNYYYYQSPFFEHDF